MWCIDRKQNRRQVKECYIKILFKMQLKNITNVKGYMILLRTYNLTTKDTQKKV